MRIINGLLALALFAPFTAALDSEVAGEHFAVHVHFDSPRLAQESLELVEAVWPVAAELFGVAKDVPEEKLQIHLYRNAGDYVAAEEPLTQGRFARNLAFTHWDTGFAHLALQPDRSDALLEELGLNYQTARLLTHEASHVVRLHACNSFRSHPRWFADAVASWVDLQVLTSEGWLADPMADPYYSSMAVRLQAKAEKEELPALHTVIDGEDGEQGWQGTYDLHAQLFPFLLAQGKGDVLGEICTGVRRLGGGSGFSDKLAQVVYEVLKRKPDQLDRAFPKFLDESQPQWEQLYTSLYATGDDWQQLAFPSANAIAWRTAGVKKGKLTLAGELKVMPAESTQLNILLDRQDGSFVQVCIVAGYGVTVFEHFSEGNVWKRRVSLETLVPLDEFIAFEVRTKAGELSLKLAGETILKVKLERELDGPWGLGVQKGGAGVWRKVRAK